MSAIQINQLAGLGDILHCQKIAYWLLNKYDTVYWPVVPQYEYIDKYLKHPDSIIFGECPTPCEILDLQNASKIIHGKGIMESKYFLANVPMARWQHYIQFNRNIEKETSLAYAFVDVEDFPICENPYALVCREYATPPETFRADFEPKTKLPIITIERFIDDIKDTTPFDWCMLIENATELHLVDTVFTYLAEVLQLKAKKMCLYKRDKHENQILTKGLWSKPWEYME